MTALARGACLVALAVACAGVGDALAARPASPGVLCVSMLPPRAPLPRGIGLPALATTTLPLSPNALAHHAICRPGVYSPSDGARYNVNWIVFPSHALALADLDALNPRSIYVSVASMTPAAGFPKPAYLIRGTYDYFGRVEPIVTVTFVDGPALVSGSMLGGGTSGQAGALSQWAERDIGRIDAR